MTLQDMTDEFGTMVSPTTLVIRRWLPGPVDRIWSYLIDGEKRRKWLAAGEMTLSPGAPLELVWRNDELSSPSDPRPEDIPAEHRLESRVIAFDPLRSLTIAWGNGEVTFELEPKGDRVLLTLTHTGLSERSAKLMVSAGWHAHLDLLVSEASGSTPASFWASWSSLKAEYANRIPS
ncbi:SRPBCC family protein [Paracoccus sp. MBLB3053]|uniref:SRPBCC family protein n=1 Tax=Paracoccus aurantius TaxID=3073814 RepID=A0ABU2HW57_9RHOB|nr:SRPBCC family protein [Paracoccus sp. MBLB3053]MDS9469297.1 SRPBCC family protein [Paracoccus sp. MBLB3053]